MKKALQENHKSFKKVKEQDTSRKEARHQGRHFRQSLTEGGPSMPGPEFGFITQEATEEF